MIAAPLQITESPHRIDLAPGSSTWRRMTLRNDGSPPVAGPNVMAADQVDFGDLRKIVAHVCTPAMSEAEKATALFDWLRATVPKWALPNLEGAEDPVRILNVYGYCNCGGFSSTLTTLATAAGLKARNVHLPGHGVAEIWHDDGWRLYDANLQVVYRKPDGEIASIEDIHDDLGLLDGAEHDFHAPRGFNLDELRRIYGERQVWHPEPAPLHDMGFDLQSGETIAWVRDERAKFYPYQNEVFMVQPPPGYYASGTLQFDGGTVAADEAKRPQSLRMVRHVPWAILGGRVRVSGFRTPRDGQVSLLLRRGETEITVGGILTEHHDFEGDFTRVFDFSAAAVLPPPAQPLFSADLELIVYKTRPESELRLDSVQVEIDLQRAPQTLPPAELDGVDLVYRDDAGRRNVTIAIE